MCSRQVEFSIKRQWIAALNITLAYRHKYPSCSVIWGIKSQRRPFYYKEHACIQWLNMQSTHTKAHSCYNWRLVVQIFWKSDLHKLITNRILKIIDRTPFYSIGRIGIYTFLHSLPLFSLFFLSLSKPIFLSLGALWLASQ